MSSTVDNKVDIFDVKKTPEIYPMTSIHETFEYFHDKMNQLNKRAYENSAMMQRLAEQVQQLSTRTHKPAASIEQAQQPAPQPLRRRYLFQQLLRWPYPPYPSNRRMALQAWSNYKLRMDIPCYLQFVLVDLFFCSGIVSLL